MIARILAICGKIASIPARLKLWAAAAFGVLMLAFGIYRKGVTDTKAKHKADEAKAYRETVERVSDEKPSSATTDALRERMRQRARKP